ncbi:MAG: hypothetical protein CBC13_04140 [Planctomycetia bacterium TMED53]|nr:MAG: hypothetical protein CBC13_04140 [Planctomycetia bacterium TMED53]
MNTSAISPKMGPHNFRCLMFVKASITAKKLRSLPPQATLILDLEDSIPTEEKAQQRQKVRRLFEMGLFRDRSVILRINGPDQPIEMRSDLSECLHKDLNGIMVPMVQSATELRCIGELLKHREENLNWGQGHFSLIPLIERPGAVLALEEISRSSSRIAALAFGHVDYCVEMHSEIDEECYADAQMKVLQTARACRLSAVSTVYLDLANDEGFKLQNKRMKKLGFDGCFALHPRQAEMAAKIFCHTMEEIEHSKRVIAACHEQGTIAILDGEMIGPPMLKIAERILQEHALAKREVA